MTDKVSLPSRERGLKLHDHSNSRPSSAVAPLAGAWIEIPHGHAVFSTRTLSLPSRERGLKCLE